jgi:hypothetical protein
MNAKQQLNLILGVLALVLLGVLYLSPKKEPPKSGPLTSLKPESVNHIVIHHPAAADIVLDKKDGAWMLTAPVQAPAEAFQVDSLTALASQETTSTIDPKQVKLADLGLDPPGFSVTLNDVKIDFGGTEPLKYSRYAYLAEGAAGARVALIDDPSATVVDADYSDLVSRKLLPEAATVEKLALPGLTISRGADGKQWTAEPADPNAAADAPQQLADAWANARAISNAASPSPQASPAATPASAPASANDTVIATLKGGTTLTFNIVARDPELVLERADLKLRYTLSKDQVSSLLMLAQKPPSAPPAPAPGPAASAPPAPKTDAK